MGLAVPAYHVCPARLPPPQVAGGPGNVNRYQVSNIFRGWRIEILAAMTDTFADEDLDVEHLSPDDDDIPGDIPPAAGASGEYTGPDMSFMDSPDFGDFVKLPKTARAREYEKRTASALKAAMLACLGNPGTEPDAAAIIYHGSSFSKAAGLLADKDERAARFIDILTSPDNPYILFALAAVPLVSQLARNHEKQLAAVPGKVKMSRAERKAQRASKPAVEVTIPFIKRKIKLPFRIKIGLSIFRTQSVDPNTLMQRVFNDPVVVRELRKQGMRNG